MSAKNIGKKFLQLVDKHFGKNSPYHKIFNRSTIKVSYSCMSNVKSIINGHNLKVLNRTTAMDKSKDCNCRNSNKCPVKGHCQAKNVIYQATVISKDSTKIYVGSTGRRFKDRYAEHKSSFKKENPEGNYTELAKHIHMLNRNQTSFTISWSLIHRMKDNSKRVAKICQTCNLERWEIARADRRTMLNKRSELTGKCPHFRKLYF